MPNTHSTLRGLFSDIADAIREKDGSSGTIVADTFPDAIRAIPTGGGGEAATSKDVNFIDCDGTILYSYTKSEFAVLTEMPDNPSHDGLTAQGWNWSLSDAKTYVASYGKLIIGQMYATDDGNTRIHISLAEGRTSPMFGTYLNGTMIVDWGDGKAATTLHSASYTSKWTSKHTYSKPGDYVITLTVTGTNARADIIGLAYSSASDNRNGAYKNAIQKLEIGSGITGFTYLGNCYSLKNITFPSGFSGAIYLGNCYSLTSVTIPSRTSSYVTLGSLQYCDSLKHFSMPRLVSTITTSCFEDCASLSTLAIPSGVSQISDYAFRRCYNLTSIVIPNSVTKIGAGTFYQCYGLGSIKFTRTTPPTVSNSNAWTNIPTDCKIYVPSASLSKYKSATNYPSSSTYTYVGY